MEFNEFSCNNEVYNIGKTDVNNIIVSSDSIGYIDDDYSIGATSALVNWSWVGIILLSFVVWLVCIISLILNIVKKNPGKAIFSGIGLIAPIVAIILASVGRSMIMLDDELNIGIIPLIIGAILQVVFIIVPFIFCFSKNRNNVNQPQNMNQQNNIK